MQSQGRSVEKYGGSRHLQILLLGCLLPGRVGGVKYFRLGLKCLTPHALTGTLAGSGVFGEKEKSVMVQSKKEKVIAVGVKNRHFGVRNEKTDSRMLSPKHKAISLAYLFS